MKKLNILLAVLLVVSLIVPNVALAQDVSGNVSVAGSTTVQPLAETLAEAFTAQNPDVEITVQGGGSSVGVKSAGQGAADIGMASREVKDSEKAEYPELKIYTIARDGIAIVVHPDVPVDGLTIAQVRDIFAGNVTNWSEVGGPDKMLIVVAREEGSGTRAAFEEMVMDEALIVDTALLQASNGAVRTTVSTTPDAIGFLSFGYLDESVKGLQIDGVAPTPENAGDGSYPVVRPLNMMTLGEPSGAAAAWLDFILGDAGQALVAEDYIPVSAPAAAPDPAQESAAAAELCDETYAVQADDWLSKLADKYFGDVMAYPVIVEATNQVNAQDSSFAKIDNPDLIEIGWKLCIPKASAVAEVQPSAPAAAEGVSGNVSVAGSTTVQPLAETLAEAFTAQNPDVEITVQGGGSSVGVKSAGQGAADIGMASREVKDSEKAEYPELQIYTIARDGIAIVVHPDVPVDGLTIAQVRDIFAGNITNWSEVGGPDKMLIVVAREEGSGTRAAFEEMVMDEALIVDTALLQASNGAVRTTVSTTPDAIGFLSFGYLDESVKGLQIDGVAPTPENAGDGSYPVVRPLNMMILGEPSGAAAAWLDFILGDAGQALVAEDYIPVQ